MTLKEELSLSYKKAIAEKRKEDEKKEEKYIAERERFLEDLEMRQTIEQRIEPILRLMHEKHPCEKKLSIQISFGFGPFGYGHIYYTPMLKDVKLPWDLQAVEHVYHINGKTMPKHLDIFSEFGIDVQEGEQDENSQATYIVTMNLED